MMTLWQDLRYGLRMLARNPGFTAIALVTLAVGIGANTIMFSISDLLLLRPPNVKDPGRLAYCAIQNARISSFRYPAYLTLRESDLGFSDVMAQWDAFGNSATLVHGDSARHVQTTFVSANYFSFLGAAPFLGRGFLPEEERQGTAPVVVLSHRCWQRLGSDPTIVGEFLSVDAIRCQVVGVAPKGFHGATLVGPDLWLPLGNCLSVAKHFRERTKPADAPSDWGYPRVDVVGRLKPGLDMAGAQVQLQVLAPRFKQEYPDDWQEHASLGLRPPGRFLIEGSEDTRLVMAVFSLVVMASSATVLLIACLNLGNMLIVQGNSRQREIAVRMALGGGRRRIIRQLLVEAGLLALLGGVFGIVLAFWGIRILNILISSAKEGIRYLQPDLNARVLMVTLGFCLLATVLFGLRPALWLSHRDIASEMKASGGSLLGSLRRRRGGVSVVGQIALAVALVLCASLLTRSALELARSDSGFPLEDKLVVQVDPSSTGYDEVRIAQACGALADHLASLPDVQALATSNRLFYGGGGPVSVREYQPGADGTRRPVARQGALVGVSRDYFAAMGIPLLRGRLFNRLDCVPDAERVAIIDESLARKLEPDGEALGRFIQWGMYGDYHEPLRVIGIVAHLPGVERQGNHAQMYTPDPGEAPPYFYLHVEHQASLAVLRRRIPAEIRRVDPRIPILSVATLAEIRHDDYKVWSARFGARLALGAGAAALFLATLGIYAIKGYMVASRTSEIGIRKALGATHGSIVGMVLKEGLVLTMLGLAIGLMLGLAVAKVAARFLYGIGPADPVSIGVTVLLLGAASLLASYLPGRRAARIDPMEALRCE